MRKMLRLTALATLTVMLALLFTGCHGARETVSFELPDGLDMTREYEITFWAKNDTNMTQVGIYHDTIAAFEELYPNVTVNLKLYTDYNTIYQDVITNIATATTPNVCITYPDHIATYLTGEDVVVPLDSLMTDRKWGLGGSELRFDGPDGDEIVGRYLDEGKIGGVQYALPFMRSTEACYVNRTYVEALGYELPEVLTWDFVFEVSEAAMKKNADGTFAVNGQKTLIPFIYKSTDNMMIQMLEQLDAGYSTPAGDILIFNEDTEKLLFEIAEHAGTRAFSTFAISSYPANFLNAGQCIFAVDSTAGATWMGSDAPNIDVAESALVDFELEVMTVPQFNTDSPEMISQGPSVCIFNKEDSEEVLVSWLFTQFLLTNEVQISYATTEGYIPVTEKAQQSAEYLDYLSRGGEDNDYYYSVKIEATELLLDNIGNTFTTPVFNGSASLRNAAGQLIESVTKSMRRRENVDGAYIDKLFSDVTSLYRLNEITASEGGGVSLGEIPAMSIVLLATLGGIWVLIGAYLVWQYLKKRERESQ